MVQASLDRGEVVYGKNLTLAGGFLADQYKRGQYRFWGQRRYKDKGRGRASKESIADAPVWHYLKQETCQDQLAHEAEREPQRHYISVYFSS